MQSVSSREGSDVPESRSPAEEWRRGLAGRVSHLAKESCQLNREFRAALFFIVGPGLGRKWKELTLLRA